MGLTLHYDFKSSLNLEPANGVGITCPFVRATPATFVDWEGIIRTVPSGEPRFTGCRRVENLFLQSNDLSVGWFNTASTDSQNVGADPWGGNTANSLDEDGTAATFHGIANPATFVLGRQYTASFYVKASNRSWVWLGFPGAAFPTSASAYFDVGNGVKGSQGGGLLGYSMEDAGNGWFRCSITGLCDSSFSSTVSVWVAEADGDVVFDGLTQESLLISGSQLEEVSGQADQSPSAYLATTTAVVSQRLGTYRTPFERTNMLLYSEDLTGPAWSVAVADGVINADAAIAPDGKTTADRLIDDESGGTGNCALLQNMTIRTSTPYIYSIYAKADGLDFVHLRLFNFTTPTDGGAYFNLTTGAVDAIDAGFDASGIENVGSGWFRCWVRWTSDAADPDGALAVYPSSGSTVGDLTIDLDGTSSIFLWGGQTEVGDHGDASVPSTYIPTEAAAVSAAASNPLDGTALPNIRGLLIEEARTNYALHSEDFSDAAWVKTTMTVAAGTGLAPDGSTNVTKLTATGANSLMEQILTLSNSFYMAGIYIRRITGTGEVGIRSDAGLYSTITLTSDWQELSDIVQVTNPRCSLRIVTSGDEVEVWGGSLKSISSSAAMDTPGSYIKTEASAVAKDVDDTTSLDVSWFNSSEGTFYLAADQYDVTDACRQFHMTDGVATTEEIRLLGNSGRDLNWLTRNGGSFQVSSTQAVARRNNIPSHCAFAFAVNDAYAAFDGVVGSNSPDTSGALPTGIDRWVFGRDIVSLPQNMGGHIAEFRYYNTRLSDAIVLDMSAGNFGSLDGLGFSRSLSRSISRSASRANGG